MRSYAVVWVNLLSIGVWFLSELNKRDWYGMQNCEDRLRTCVLQTECRFLLVLHSCLRELFILTTENRTSSAYHWTVQQIRIQCSSMPLHFPPLCFGNDLMRQHPLSVWLPFCRSVNYIYFTFVHSLQYVPKIKGYVWNSVCSQYRLTDSDEIWREHSTIGSHHKLVGLLLISYIGLQQ
jgi:hypothetical protein